MLIRWSPEAADDVERIVDRIKQDNPTAARQWRRRFIVAARIWSFFPIAVGSDGSPAPANSCSPLPYIVVYRVNPDAVEIARIYHSAQNWP
jgi:plasmid stabilization system protein ParE